MNLECYEMIICRKDLDQSDNMDKVEDMVVKTFVYDLDLAKFSKIHAQEFR